MSGVANRLKQSIFGTYRTLSVDSDTNSEEKSNKEKNSLLDSIITKLSNHDRVPQPILVHTATERNQKILLIIDSPENEWYVFIRFN